MRLVNAVAKVDEETRHKARVQAAQRKLSYTQYISQLIIKGVNNNEQ